MRRRDRSGLAIAPLFLRLGLAATFIWAGLGKFMGKMEVQGEQAAILANYGVIPNPHGGAVRPAPPTTEPEAQPAPEEGAGGAGEGRPDDGQASASGWGRGRLAAWQAAGPDLATAADFPEPVQVAQWKMLVLGLHAAAHPGLSAEDSSPLMPLWPDFDPNTEYDPWPKYMALAVALTELIGGILIAVGLLTRLGALGVAGVMLGALWLTVIGPAVQSGDTVLGFLPKHAPFDGEAWTGPLWVFTLLCTALGLFFAGPGTLSLDRLLMGGPKAPAKPAPPPAPAKK